MPELTVKPNLEQGIVVLKISYGPDQMFQRETAMRLSEQLLSAYTTWIDKEGVEDRKSCITVIEAQTAGSPLVRGLFDLYKAVRRKDGQLICANYPADYLESITTLGLPALPGFILVSKPSDAFRRLGR
jgi:hypothetical protein